MQTQYIYSVSRVNTLAQYLLTTIDIDRLLVADAGSDLHNALKETYLAPYISKAQDEDMATAIEDTLVEAKNTIEKIAPNAAAFRVLWVQYDIHNLRVFAKAAAIKKTFDEVVIYTSARGVYTPADMYAYVAGQQLDAVYPNWQTTYDAALRHAMAGEIDKVDGLFDQLFFDTAKHIADNCKEQFIKQYVAAAIDLYNLKGALRSATYPHIAFTPVFVRGGTIGPEQLTGQTEITHLFGRFGGVSFWQSAVDQLNGTKNTTALDARVDDYLLTIAKRGSADMFSAAALVLYYLQVRQSAANVRTIVVGKNSSMSEAVIRTNLRLAYVN